MQGVRTQRSTTLHTVRLQSIMPRSRVTLKHTRAVRDVATKAKAELRPCGALPERRSNEEKH